MDEPRMQFSIDAISETINKMFELVAHIKLRVDDLKVDARDILAFCRDIESLHDDIRNLNKNQQALDLATVSDRIAKIHSRMGELVEKGDADDIRRKAHAAFVELLDQARSKIREDISLVVKQSVSPDIVSKAIVEVHKQKEESKRRWATKWFTLVMAIIAMITAITPGVIGVFRAERAAKKAEQAAEANEEQGARQMKIVMLALSNISEIVQEKK